MTGETSDEPSFWTKAWALLKRMGRPALVALPVILLVLGAIVLVILGAKNLQIGGLLGKLTGKERLQGKKALDVANSIPKGRVDAEGKLIPIGTPDEEGVTQAVVVSIETPGLFDDPTQVKIVPPGQTEPIVIDLPKGVEAKDVETIVVVKPEILVVTVKDETKVSKQQVDDLLRKYSK